MAPVDVLPAFFTPETPAACLHRVILIYRTHINLSGTTFPEHGYIMKLFNESCYSLRPLSLTINHEQIPSVAIWYLKSQIPNHMKSLFDDRKQLTLIECTARDLDYIIKYLKNLKQLEQLHIIVRRLDKDMRK
ncbi:unnamed protein product [Rotaria sp. Silwood2]|nr:unnamed protein product [Rotaria sp. Silwood2]CAF2859329.1 unnamed protein product [Rotaria sp. Silwood2]CAF3317119.1 unnamed protein product [Rotaria sp. Silwood2]CAF3324016.1 unnamed protein product [Rotaria sp. Silwood2]CAF3923933.1 unnamed protein product [Rotaria sp. Silwood2]